MFAWLVRLTLGAGAMLFAVAALAALAGVRINTTASMPLGLYAPDGAPLQRGSIVAACPPATLPAVALALERGYLPGGSCPAGNAPLLKRVAAVAGDSVEFTSTAVVVNGRGVAGTAALQRDGEGRSLPRPPAGPAAVPAGYVLLLAPDSPASFDSRYIGLVPLHSVRATVRPLYTW